MFNEMKSGRIQRIKRIKFSHTLTIAKKTIAPETYTCPSMMRLRDEKKKNGTVRKRD